jgi:hypothetical protein
MRTTIRTPLAHYECSSFFRVSKEETTSSRPLQNLKRNKHPSGETVAERSGEETPPSFSMGMMFHVRHPGEILRFLFGEARQKTKIGMRCSRIHSSTANDQVCAIDLRELTSEEIPASGERTSPPLIAGPTEGGWRRYSGFKRRNLLCLSP